jgi:hypothetical protein
LASVGVNNVRDVINVGSAEVPDAKVSKMIKRAEVTLELETDREIDYSNCMDVRRSSSWFCPAAIYAICYLTEASVSLSL